MMRMSELAMAATDAKLRLEAFKRLFTTHVNAGDADYYALKKVLTLLEASNEYYEKRIKRGR